MELACNSYTLRTLPRDAALAEFGRLGFGAVELWAGHAPFGNAAVRPGDVLRDAAAAGVRLRAYCVGGLFGLPPATAAERLARAVGFAQELGVELVTVILDRAAVAFADALAVRSGVRLALENHWYTELARPRHCA